MQPDFKNVFQKKKKIVLKEIVLKNRNVREIILEMAEIAGYLWERGWAEQNAGNISVNITDILNRENLQIPDGSMVPFPERKNMHSEGMYSL